MLASKYSGNAKRVRHFLVRLNFMIEQVAHQVVHLEYLNTLDHPADLCTKGLPPVQFEKSNSMDVQEER